MKHYIYIFILLTSCNSIPPQVHIVNNFPYTINLKGNEITSFDNELGIMGLYVTDNYFLCSSHRTEFHFSVYSKDSIAKIINLCKQGRGPGEFISPMYFSQYQIENEETKIWVLDRGTSTFYLINIEQSIRMQNTYIEKSFSLLDYNRQSFRDAYYLNDSTLFGTEDYKECRYLYINTKDTTIKNVDTSIKFTNDYDPFPIAQKLSTINPQNKCIASAYFSFPQIDLINNSGEILKTIVYKEYINPRQVTLLQANEEYYSAICSDQHYIYALYNRENNLVDEIKTESSIFVFSW